MLGVCLLVFTAMLSWNNAQTQHMDYTLTYIALRQNIWHTLKLSKQEINKVTCHKQNTVCWLKIHALMCCYSSWLNEKAITHVCCDWWTSPFIIQFVLVFSFSQSVSKLQKRDKNNHSWRQEKWAPVTNKTKLWH